MKKILFLTATRAEYGKLKPIMKELESDDKNYEVNIFVTGMHMLGDFGKTYEEILKDGYENIYLDDNYKSSDRMEISLAQVVSSFSECVENVQPNLIVVHGDRLDALAGAIVGAFSNVLVAHIEGGEVSGTIDESIRHAVTKLSHIHLVANKEARKRLIQLGEDENSVFIIGSPDIDIMQSNNLPTLEDVQKRYEIKFDNYAIMINHPVVTELEKTKQNINVLLDAVNTVGNQLVIILPNNDSGSETIIEAYSKIIDDENIRILPSMRFEYFLTLLKNADYIIGNSSAGIREACVYGIPAIDVGTRQQNRYSCDVVKNIQHVDYDKNKIIDAIKGHDQYQEKSAYFGDGNSAKAFHALLDDSRLWNTKKQKVFVDLEF